jgi:hypothetical protein
LPPLNTVPVFRGCPRAENISKSDMLDEELINDIKKELPPHVPHIFISSLTNKI